MNTHFIPIHNHEIGIPRIWMHRSFGEGSVNEDAAELARRNGIEVIVGGCPMMFAGPVDIGHKCMRWILGITGGLPDPIMPEVISTRRKETMGGSANSRSGNHQPNPVFNQTASYPQNLP